jgi:hypothetical protein
MQHYEELPLRVKIIKIKINFNLSQNTVDIKHYIIVPNFWLFVCST